MEQGGREQKGSQHGGNTGKLGEGQSVTEFINQFDNPEYRDRQNIRQEQDLSAVLAQLSQQFQTINFKLENIQSDFLTKFENQEKKLEKRLRESKEHFEKVRKEEVPPATSKGHRAFSEFQDKSLEAKKEKQNTQVSTHNIQFIQGSDLEDDQMSLGTQNPLDFSEKQRILREQTGSNTKEQGEYVVPDQFIAMADFPLYEPEQDLNLYFKQLENSYVGFIPSDVQKINKALNKLIKVQYLYNSASILSETYTNYPRWRNLVLRLHGKSKDSIHNEYDDMERFEGESMISFVDRMHTLLANPIAKIPQSEMRTMIVLKLPKFYKTVVRRSNVKDFFSLRQCILDIENDPTQQQMQEMQSFMERLNRDSSLTYTASNQRGYQSNTREQSAGDQQNTRGYYGGRYQGRYQGRGRNYQNRYQGRGGRYQNQSRIEENKSVENNGQDQQTQAEQAFFADQTKEDEPLAGDCYFFENSTPKNNTPSSSQRLSQNSDSQNIESISQKVSTKSFQNLPNTANKNQVVCKNYQIAKQDISPDTQRQQIQTTSSLNQTAVQKQKNKKHQEAYLTFDGQKFQRRIQSSVDESSKSSSQISQRETEKFGRQSKGVMLAEPINKYTSTVSQQISIKNTTQPYSQISNLPVLNQYSQVSKENQGVSQASNQTIINDFAEKNISKSLENSTQKSDKICRQQRGKEFIEDKSMRKGQPPSLALQKQNLEKLSSESKYIQYNKSNTRQLDCQQPKSKYIQVLQSSRPTQERVEEIFLEGVQREDQEGIGGIKSQTLLPNSQSVQIQELQTQVAVSESQCLSKEAKVSNVEGKYTLQDKLQDFEKDKNITQLQQQNQDVLCVFKKDIPQVGFKNFIGEGQFDKSCLYTNIPVQNCTITKDTSQNFKRLPICKKPILPNTSVKNTHILENTEAAIEPNIIIHKAKGENSFVSKLPTISETFTLSKEQLNSVQSKDKIINNHNQKIQGDFEQTREKNYYKGILDSKNKKAKQVKLYPTYSRNSCKQGVSKGEERATCVGEGLQQIHQLGMDKAQVDNFYYDSRCENPVQVRVAVDQTSNRQGCVSGSQVFDQLPSRECFFQEDIENLKSNQREGNLNNNSPQNIQGVESKKEKHTLEIFPIETRGKGKRQAGLENIPVQELDDFDSEINSKRKDSNDDTFMDESQEEGIKRKFQYLNREQPSKDELNRRIFEAQFRKDSTIVLDKGIFVEQGGLNLSRLKKSVCVILSIEELEQIEKMAKQGHCPIFYQQGIESESKLDLTKTQNTREQESQEKNQEKDQENPKESYEVFVQQLAFQGQLAQEVARVENAGQHVLLNISVQNQRVQAVLDTGAVRSIASQSLIERLPELQNHLKYYVQPEQLNGISGGTCIPSYLKNINLFFDKQIVNIDIPVVAKASFSLLIGQDILLNTLYNCSLHFKSLKLCYEVMQNNISYKCEMPLELRTNNRSEVLFADIVQDNLQELWPNINKVQGPYDVALIDLPLTGPKFFGKKIPYPTQPTSELVFFKFVLQKIMKKDAILLLWCSGRTIQELLYLIAIWGFQFVNILFVWVKYTKGDKPFLGMGFWTRANCEFIILAKRGKGILQLKGQNRAITQSFYTMNEPCGDQHSAKPLKIYQVLGEVFDLKNSRNIELFARDKQHGMQRGLFDLYGNEIEDYFQPRRDEINLNENPILYMDMSEVQGAAITYLEEGKHEHFCQFIDALNMDEELKRDREVLRVLAQQFESFDYDSKIGRAKNIELELNFRPNAKVAKTPDIQYDEEREDFLKTKIKQWEASKFIRKGFAKYLFTPVIVGKRGSKDKFRVCYNFQPLNEALLDVWFKAKDADQIRATMGKAKYICVIDMPYAHQQIPIKRHQRWLIGLKTPFGVYVSEVAQFGMLTISKVFGEGVKLSIGHLEKHGVLPYVDDVYIFGETLKECLWSLEQTLASLRKDGYVVSSTKCQLFKREVNVLGQIVCEGKVKIDPSRIEAIQQIPLPKNKIQMQKFIGMLTYLRKFLPHIASILTPLYASLKQREDQVFQLTPIQVKLFEEAKALVVSHSVLDLPRLDQPFYLTICFNTYAYSAGLYQKEQKNLRPIAFRSKTRATSVFKPQYIHKLEALTQAIGEWKHLFTNQRVIILTENLLLKHCLSFNGDNVYINRMLMKINDVNYEIQIKPESFRGLCLTQCLLEFAPNGQMDHLEELLTEYERQRIMELDKPKGAKGAELVDVQFKPFEVTFFFDGACTRKRAQNGMGAWGFVAFSNQKEVLYEACGAVKNLGEITNNVSESYSLLQVVKYIKEKYSKITKIQIIGDSQLTLRQMAGTYRINSNDLRALLRDVKFYLRGYKDVKFLHVPRENNEHANQLAQGHLKEMVAKTIEEAKSEVFFVQPDIITQLHCVVCGSMDEKEMLLCDKCGHGQHQSCLGEMTYPSKESFFCKNCETYIYEGPNGSNSDITNDQNLLDYLGDPTIRLSKKEQQRCERLSKMYFLKDGNLFFRMEDSIRRVPSIAERHLLSIQIHQSLGHPGQGTTLSHIKAQYFWPGMAADVKGWVSMCLICQARRTQYCPMPSIAPLFKGMTIWKFVAIDLMEVRSSDEKHCKYILTCIDAYSKAPELIPLSDKKATSVRDAFRDQVIMRYGNPAVVRTDGGTEFLGEFDSMLNNYKILHVKLGPRYPQANGQIERLNGLIKQKLQGLYNSEEYSDRWSKLIQVIAFAIRISRSRSTGFSPFEIMYGRQPDIPGHIERVHEDCFQDPSDEKLAYLLEKVVAKHEENHQVILSNLKKMDQEIIETIEKREFRRLTNLQYGQAIFVNTSQATKLNLEASGVFYFIRYLTGKRDAIIYYNPQTQRFLTATIGNVKLCNLEKDQE